MSEVQNECGACKGEQCVDKERLNDLLQGMASTASAIHVHRQRDEELRLRCLELAIHGNAASRDAMDIVLADNAVESATVFYNFITNEPAQPNE